MHQAVVSIIPLESETAINFDEANNLTLSIHMPPLNQLDESKMSLNSNLHNNSLVTSGNQVSSSHANEKVGKNNTKS